MNSKICGTWLRGPLDPKSSGNGSTGIDLHGKQKKLKKLFFFENELIEVENYDFLMMLLISLKIL